MYSYDGIEALAAGFFAFFGIIMLFALAALVLMIISLWKILEKGNKPGWGALIPFYNLYLLCDMTGVNPWWVAIFASIFVAPFILAAIPFIGFIGILALEAAIVYFQVLLSVSLARSLNKETEFAFGIVYLPIVFLPILAFSNKANYVGKNPMKDLLFDNLKENNNSNVNEAQYTENTKYCPACGNKMETDTKYCPKCGKEL